MLVKVQQLQQQLDPRSQLRPEDSEGRESDPARGARAGGVTVVHTGTPRNQVSQPGQARVEGLDIGFRGTFLRPVDRRRTQRPGQRVVHIAGDDDLRVREPGVQPGQVDLGELQECTAAVRELGARPVAKAGSQRLEHPGAAVGARAPANAQHDSLRATVEGLRDQLPRPAACRAQCRRGAAGKAGEPGDVGHLNQGGVAVDGVRGIRGLADGSGRGRGDPFETGGHGSFEGAVPAVGDRDAAHRKVRSGGDEAALHRVGHLDGAERALELVGGDHDTNHGTIEASPSAARFFDPALPQARLIMGGRGSHPVAAHHGRRVERV
jgi:hypothetical protein